MMSLKCYIIRNNRLTVTIYPDDFNDFSVNFGSKNGLFSRSKNPFLSPFVRL